MTCTSPQVDCYVRCTHGTADAPTVPTTTAPPPTLPNTIVCSGGGGEGGCGGDGLPDGEDNNNVPHIVSTSFFIPSVI